MYTFSFILLGINSIAQQNEESAATDLQVLSSKPAGSYNIFYLLEILK